jgi:Flp pilus assembly protein TadD
MPRGGVKHPRSTGRAADINQALGLTDYFHRPPQRTRPVLAMVTAGGSPASAPPRSRRTGLGALVLPIGLAIALSACTGSKGVSPEMTGAIAKPVSDSDYEKASEYWAQRYEAKPKDAAVAFNYALTLRRLGRTDQAVAVLQGAAINHPEDRVILAAYGKALADAGDLNRSLEIIRRAQQPDRPDWKLISAEAAILDQLGDHQQARKLYAQSLDLAPNEPSVLSNYGMSYVLTGELAEAERILRQASSLANADSRVRQNLALVVGLSGRFAEAEKIASAELPPEQAAANVAYLKTMLAQQNSWEKLKTTEVAAATN